MSAVNAIAAFGKYFESIKFVFDIPLVGKLYPGMLVTDMLYTLLKQSQRRLLHVFNDKPGQISYKDECGLYLQFIYTGEYIVGIRYKDLKSLVDPAMLYTVGKYTYLTDIISDDCMLRFTDADTVLLKKAAGASTHVMESEKNIQRLTQRAVQIKQSYYDQQLARTDFLTGDFPVLKKDDTVASAIKEKDSITKQVDALDAEIKIVSELSDKVQKAIWNVEKKQKSVDSYEDDKDTAYSKYVGVATGYTFDRCVNNGKIYRNSSGFYRLVAGSDKTRKEMKPVYDEIELPMGLIRPYQAGYRLLKGDPGLSDTTWVSIEPDHYNEVTVVDYDYENAKQLITKLAVLESEYWTIVASIDTRKQELSKAMQELENLRAALLTHESLSVLKKKRSSLSSDASTLLSNALHSTEGDKRR